jgi:hypothetical protein
VVFVLTGLDIEAKAALVKAQMEGAVDADIEWTLARTDHPDAATEQEASALLQCVVRSDDPDVVGRAFSGAAIELALASYPGFNVTAPPSNGSPYGVFTAAYLDAKDVDHVAVTADGTRHPIETPTAVADLQPSRTRSSLRNSTQSCGPTHRRRNFPSARSPSPAAATRAARPTSASGFAPMTSGPGSSPRCRSTG